MTFWFDQLRRRGVRRSLTANAIALSWVMSGVALVVIALVGTDLAGSSGAAAPFRVIATALTVAVGVAAGAGVLLVQLPRGIDGVFFGTSDGQDGNAAQPEDGAGWLNDNHPDTSNKVFKQYHVLPSLLTPTFAYAPTLAFSAGKSLLKGATVGQFRLATPRRRPAPRSRTRSRPSGNKSAATGRQRVESVQSTRVRSSRSLPASVATACGSAPVWLALGSDRHSADG